jgi:Protein of unknown function (DUF3011)
MGGKQHCQGYLANATLDSSGGREMFTTNSWVRLAVAVAVLVIFGPRSSAQTISCSSDDGRRHYCSADTRGRVRLLQQRSDSPCREGYSWGTDRKGVWVDHGCRADFAVEERRGGWGGGVKIKIMIGTEIVTRTATGTVIATVADIDIIAKPTRAAESSF